MDFNTKILHGTKTNRDKHGSITMPVYQTNAFYHETPEQLERVFQNKTPGFSYSRTGNPTVAEFETKMTLLEKGLGAVACASGMAAISMALLGFLKAGDEIITNSGLFGGTIDLFEDFRALDINVVTTDTLMPEHLQNLITDKTRAVFTELIGNPKLNVADIRGLSDVCKKHSLPFIVDSTTASPYLFRPIESGADIVVHSSSKYINGGGNALSGVIIDSGNFHWDPERYPTLAPYQKFGKLALLSKLRQDTWRNFGACLSSQSAFMNLVGLDTLGLRMERACCNAKALAEALSKVDALSVNYPGLPGHPDHKLVQDNFYQSHAGAILTIRTGTKEKAYQLLNGLKYAFHATNIGDVRTLVIHPSSTIYAKNSDEVKESAGVYDDLIRISVGIEDINDLIQDFTDAAKQL